MPVIDLIAGDYEGEVAFVAVAGRAPLDRTAARAQELFSANLMWGLDESVWELYGVFGQPYTVLVDGAGGIAEAWFGVRGQDEIRAALDELIMPSV